MFKVDFLAKISALMKEAFKMKKYKCMPLPLAIIVGICMAPFILISLATAAAAGIFAFMFKVVISPLTYLHSLVHDEGQKVKHGTQVVIYLISWYALFVLYALASLALVILTLYYALLSIFTYVWTLGGFKYHVFIEDSDEISIKTEGHYNTILPAIFSAVCVFFGFFLPMLFILLDEVADTTLTEANNIMVLIYLVFAFVYSLIAFGHRPGVTVEKVEAPAAEPLHEAEGAEAENVNAEA